ncbi:protein kinase [Pendulispora brunnea]|uniref:Protein kinase n=1 Tax=Pendulispora brunnea TaxID=2905690 RepID=A0ABZ2K4B8_9BACT
MSSFSSDSLTYRALQRIGTSLCGRYRISHLLGIGGTAAVFAGVHRNGHAVAIKVLHDKLSSDPEMDRLFRREALLANKIQHAGVVPVMDDDVTDDGSTFLVMPLLVGETVRARARRNGNRLPPEEVAVIGHSLLDILQAAHAAKIVHRDIKPENIFITREGELRMLDFGIARFFETTDASITRSGRTVGTPAFMAPEQALGRIREIDGRTDLWALGATLFTLLCGRFVHEGDSANEILVLAATTKARSIFEYAADAPVGLCKVIDRALAFDRTDRWADAATMKQALIEACEAAFGRAPSMLPPLSPKLGSTDEICDAATEPPARLALDISRRSARSPVVRSNRETPPKGSRAMWLWLGIGAVALALVGGVFEIVRQHNPDSSNSAGNEPATPLATHLAASRNAWMNANIERAKSEAMEALRIDESSAKAHIAMIGTSSFWPTTDDRSHFSAAQETRRLLTPDERDYLEAIAPAMSLPPNFSLAASRLEAIHRRRPQAIEVTIALGQNLVRTKQFEKAFALLKPLADLPDAEGIVLALFALAQAMHDDVEMARETYRRCLAKFPASSVCAWDLAELELLEGNCAAAESVAQQNLDTHPTSSAYHQLANALAALGNSTNEIRNVLERELSLQNEANRNLNRLQLEFDIALYEGRLRDALDLDMQIERIVTGVHSSNNADFQASYFATSMELKAELGMISSAQESFARYRETRHTIPYSSYGGDQENFVNSRAAGLGLIPWSDWKQMRDLNVAKQSDRAALADWNQRVWLDSFVVPARDIESAKEALDALPKYLPILHRTDRWPAYDAAIGNVFRLTGRPAEATRHFERALSSCLRFDYPMDYIRALLRFGDMLASTGNQERACSSYTKLLERWPVSSGSRSSVIAERRKKDVCSK